MIYFHIYWIVAVLLIAGALLWNWWEGEDLHWDDLAMILSLIFWPLYVPFGLLFWMTESKWWADAETWFADFIRRPILRGRKKALDNSGDKPQA